MDNFQAANYRIVTWSSKMSKIKWSSLHIKWLFFWSKAINYQSMQSM